MGLKGTPATFQRLMNYIMCGTQFGRALICLDDITAYENPVQEHYDQLIDVFGRMRQHNLKLHVCKCEFLRDRLAYLR
jgi:hypothetical protein